MAPIVQRGYASTLVHQAPLSRDPSDYGSKATWPPVFLCLELPLFLSACSNFHQHHHNWNSKCLKHHKIQMTHPNAHVKLSALELPLWEATSRQSQLTCCHTQHCQLWTDIMICTIIPHATIFPFYTTSKTNIINECISSFI